MARWLYIVPAFDFQEKEGLAWRYEMVDDAIQALYDGEAFATKEEAIEFGRATAEELFGWTRDGYRLSISD